jgi:hypothetical protein
MTTEMASEIISDLTTNNVSYTGVFTKDLVKEEPEGTIRKLKGLLTTLLK